MRWLKNKENAWTHSDARRIPIKKRRLLLLSGLAVCIPLCLMMGLQYWWLLKLKRASTVARSASQDQLLALVAEKVQLYYHSVAEELLAVTPQELNDRDALSLSIRTRHGQAFRRRVRTVYKKEQPVLADAQGTAASMGSKSDDDKLEPSSRWARNPNVRLSTDIYPVLSTIFVQSFQGPASTPFYFDTAIQIAVPSLTDKTLMQTVEWACLYWSVVAQKKTWKSPELVVDERDPQYPMIIRPILDDEDQLIGIAGVVLNATYFGKVLVPDCFSDVESLMEGQEDWRLWVYDPKKNMILSKGVGRLDAQPESVKKTSFEYVFKGWTMAMSSYPSPLEQLAGTNFWLNFALSALLGSALLGGLLFALRMASHEMRLSEMKSDFVSNVSHELRTPLASIRMFGELLRLGRTSSPEKVKEYGAYIEHEGQRLSRLINNILDFSKIESGQKLYHYEQCDVEEVLMEVVATFEARNQETQTKIEYHGPQEPLPLIWLDRDAISQVFYNLLDNGVKYSREIHRLEVSLEQEGVWVQVGIRDFGVGIAKEELGKIFERFHRVSTQLVHDVKGSGLGLSIVQHVIEAHQGRVTVQSQLGEGSLFIIQLPMHRAEKEQKEQ